jgi:hypothetical protein
MCRYGLSNLFIMPSSTAFSSLKLVRQPKNIQQLVDLPKTMSSCSLNSRDQSRSEKRIREEHLSPKSEGESDSGDDCISKQLESLLLNHK